MTTFALPHRQLDRWRHSLMQTAAVVILAYAVLWAINVDGMISGHASSSHGGSSATDIAHGDSASAIAVATPMVASVIPFVVLLGSIALLPVLSTTKHWWENNWNRLAVSVGCGAMTILYYTTLYPTGVANHLTHTHSAPGVGTAMAVLSNAWLGEYIPFIVLLFSLYVISGGIVVSGRLVGSPAMNTMLIGLGTLIASFVGTTGAAMLMIRPLLRANAHRKTVVHTVVFFIFTVCNTGGCLLPIGDPPLFLGFLHGVNFSWTLSLWPMWLTMNVILIVMYYGLEQYHWRREGRPTPPVSDEAESESARVGVRGSLNFLWLFGIVAAVATLDPSRSFPGTNWYPPLYYREIVMLALTVMSLWLTPTKERVTNSFSYDAILEVAALFLGIFVCMQPALQLLNVYGSALGFDSAAKFFWGTGFLSSVLDNAPTYVVFFETASATPVTGPTVAGVPEHFLIGISLGSVFMGAMTYIGNGPNLMVKAIAESQNIKMPSFHGYVLYSAIAVIPAAVVVSLVFLS